MLYLVTVKEIGNTFIKGHTEHCYSPEMSYAIICSLNSCKRKSNMDDVFCPASHIADEVLWEHVNPTISVLCLPAPSVLVRQKIINKWLINHYQKNHKTLTLRLALTTIFNTSCNCTLIYCWREMSFIRYLPQKIN